MNSILLISFLLLFSRCNNEGNIDQALAVKKVMVVFAHADDETTVSPVLAKYSREGAKVHLIIATDGRHGIRPHFGVPAGDELASIRVSEIECVMEKLGIHSLVFLGFEDGILASQANLSPLGNKVDSLFQLINPDLMISTIYYINIPIPYSFEAGINNRAF